MILEGRPYVVTQCDDGTFRLPSDLIAHEGVNVALKPACEDWWLCRKPLDGTVAGNVLKYGTGGLNIDATRIATNDSLNGGAYSGGTRPTSMLGATGKAGGTNSMFESGGGRLAPEAYKQPAGRWPTHVLFSHVEERTVYFDEWITRTRPYGGTREKWDRVTGGADYYVAPGCVLVGTKRVKAAANSGGPAGASHNGTMGNFAGTAQQFDYADADGRETVEDWRCVDGCPIAELDRQSGTVGAYARASGPSLRNGNTSVARGRYNGLPSDRDPPFYGVRSGASKFFYCAKSSQCERNEGLSGKRNTHPTCKPIQLMRYLCRLVTPPGGTVLDPFMGSGSTGVACAEEGFSFIGVDQEPEYVEIAKARVGHAYEGRGVIVDPTPPENIDLPPLDENEAHFESLELELLPLDESSELPPLDEIP